MRTIWKIILWLVGYSLLIAASIGIAWFNNFVLGGYDWPLIPGLAVVILMTTLVPHGQVRKNDRGRLYLQWIWVPAYIRRTTREQAQAILEEMEKEEELV